MHIENNSSEKLNKLLFPVSLSHLSTPQNVMRKNVFDINLKTHLFCPSKRRQFWRGLLHSEILKAFLKLHFKSNS